MDALHDFDLSRAEDEAEIVVFSAYCGQFKGTQADLASAQLVLASRDEREKLGELKL